MTSAVPNVQLPQADLDAFAQRVVTAVGVIGPYIQTLLAAAPAGTLSEDPTPTPDPTPAPDGP
jgi:hypothetical protein